MMLPQNELNRRPLGDIYPHLILEAITMRGGWAFLTSSPTEISHYRVIRLINALSCKSDSAHLFLIP